MTGQTAAAAPVRFLSATARIGEEKEVEALNSKEMPGGPYQCYQDIDSLNVFITYAKLHIFLYADFNLS